MARLINTNKATVLRISAKAHIMYNYGKDKDTKECPRDG
jgi:hypothetical protein